MVFTTTDAVEGHRVQRCLGNLTVEVVLGANRVRELFGAVRDEFGGRAQGPVAGATDGTAVETVPA